MGLPRTNHKYSKIAADFVRSFITSLLTIRIFICTFVFVKSFIVKLFYLRMLPVILTASKGKWAQSAAYDNSLSLHSR